MTYLLAGKITANEAWKSENQQKIGDQIKDAVTRGKEIVEIRLVKIDSQFENKPQIILEFGVAIETIIRETKSSNSKQQSHHT